ncbi:hypothetical protein L6R49_26775 [Myxococcota bacterium]|nr:hypothetical protein [Myxococcota bacterium]
MISLWLLLACASPDETYTTAPGVHAELPTRELLAEWMAWRDISRAELERRLTVRESSIVRDVRFAQWSGLDRVEVTSYCPARFYLDGERVALIYITDHEPLATLKPDELAALFPPEAALQSRAFGTKTQLVNASAGVAWTTYSERVVSLELFHPTTVEQYKALFYVEPEPIPDDLGPHAR